MKPPLMQVAAFSFYGKNSWCMLKGACIVNSFSGLELPLPFPADWHHQLGDRLAVFPRYLAQLTDSENANADRYWPDLATFSESPEGALQMMYYRAESASSFLVTYWEESGQWEVLKFIEFSPVQLFAGRDFDKLVLQIAVAECMRADAE